MKMLMYVLIVLVAMAATGCSAVYTPHPMGEKPIPLKQQDWEGTWMGNGGCCVIKVIDAEKGLLKIAWVED